MKRRVVVKPGFGELSDRGSRFAGWALSVDNEEEAQAELSRLRSEVSSASHLCWALSVGGVERCSDDGEPSGAAGPPLLEVLKGQELSGALIAVARWFGGTKLGRGGLVRAYSGAGRRALEDAELVYVKRRLRVAIELPAGRISDVKRLVGLPGVELREESYDEPGVAKLTLSVVESGWESFRQRLDALGVDYDSSEEAPRI